jgi:hypothetical protein
MTHTAEETKEVGAWTIPAQSAFWLGNGQITFYYPPCVEACTEPTYEVVPSLRVKLYREGIQDYEYFEILEKKISEAKHLGIKHNRDRIHTIKN